MTGRRWYVAMDGTPILPERPLTDDEAIELFREMNADVERDGDDDTTVEIYQCTDDDIDWAGGAS